MTMARFDPDSLTNEEQEIIFIFWKHDEILQFFINGA